MTSQHMTGGLIRMTQPLTQPDSHVPALTAYRYRTAIALIAAASAANASKTDAPIVRFVGFVGAASRWPSAPAASQGEVNAAYCSVCWLATLSEHLSAGIGRALMTAILAGRLDGAGSQRGKVKCDDGLKSQTAQTLDTTGSGEISRCEPAVLRHHPKDRLEVIDRTAVKLECDGHMSGGTRDDQLVEVAVADDEVSQAAAIDVGALGGEGEQGGVHEELLVPVAVAA